MQGGRDEGGLGGSKRCVVEGGGRRDGDGRVLQAECMTRSTDTVFNNVFGVSEKVLRSSLCSSSFQQLTGCGRGVSQVGLKKGEGGEVS